MSSLLDSSLVYRKDSSGRKYLLRSDGGDAVYWPGISLLYVRRNAT